MDSLLVTKVAATTCVADQREDGTLEQCSGSGPGCRAGIRTGDIITHINGHHITGPDQVILLTQAADNDITYTVERAGKSYTFRFQPEQARRLVTPPGGAAEGENVPSAPWG